MNGINRLEDFLKLTVEEAVRYDLSTEKASGLYCEAGPTEKYIIYKSWTIHGDYGNSKVFERGRHFVDRIYDSYAAIIDPDSGSELLSVIYRKLWSDLYRMDEKIVCSDTMTSVQYTMSDYFEQFIESTGEKEARKQIASRSNSVQKCTIRYMIDLWAKSGTDPEECIRKSSSRLELIPEITAFLGAWHTLGNYCPVPCGFNSPRSNFGEHDFWDLTLMKIREWYCSEGTKSEYDRQNIIRHELLHGNERGDVLSCINWLSQFGTGMIGWRHFIDYFYLQDWVDSHYEVKPLWDGHSWENRSLPRDGEGMKKYFLEYEERIHSRSRAMFLVLKGECR